MNNKDNCIQPIVTFRRTHLSLTLFCADMVLFDSGLTNLRFFSKERAANAEFILVVGVIVGCMLALFDAVIGDYYVTIFCIDSVMQGFFPVVSTM